MQAALQTALASVKGKAEALHVRFPKVWSEQEYNRNVGACLLLHKNGDGSFNVDDTVNELKERYGVDLSKVVVELDLTEGGDATSSQESSGKKKKRKSESGDGNGDDEDDEEGGGKAKKAKKTEVMANEANREFAEALKEIADIYFKQKDMRKGGVFSKGAKAIRECPTALSNKKEAKALKGIGEGMASMLEELKASGMILKLEELRAGN